MTNKSKSRVNQHLLNFYGSAYRRWLACSGQPASWPASQPARGLAKRALEEEESADKPGSVEDNHSSGIRVAAYLERPTRKPMWATCAAPLAWDGVLPYLVLLQAGFAVPSSVTTDAVRSYRTLSPLPAALLRRRRFAFCCTFRGLASPRRYLAPCPWSPDFPPRTRRSDCLTNSGAHSGDDGNWKQEERGDSGWRIRDRRWR